MGAQDESKAVATSIFELVGGKVGLRLLTHRFYEIMNQDPLAQEVRSMHPASLAGSEEKLYLFLSGWMGGPSLYIEKYGHPRLRARHLPFKIGKKERDQWLLCMNKAMIELAYPDALREPLYRMFERVADHMRNQPEAEEGEQP